MTGSSNGSGSAGRSAPGRRDILVARGSTEGQAGRETLEPHHAANDLGGRSSIRCTTPGAMTRPALGHPGCRCFGHGRA